jgi:hypothetical protein
MCYILFMCVCGRVRFDNCMSERSQLPSLFVSCALGAFLGGSQGGQVAPPSYVQRSCSTPKKKFGQVFAILADFAIFSGFLN